MKWSMEMVLLALFSMAHCEHILFLGPVCSKSHKFAFMPIVEALAQKGHQMTVVTPYEPSKPVANVREIVTRDLFAEFDFNFFDLLKENPLASVFKMIGVFGGIATLGYDALMANAEFRHYVQHTDIDLVVYDGVANDFVLPIIGHLGAPHVTFTPSSGVTWLLAIHGISPEYASIPSGLAPFDDDMTFLQRLKNAMASEMFLALRKLYLLPLIDDHAKRDFPNGRPAAEIESRSSLVLVNHHLATGWPRSLPPNVIPVGALHLVAPKPLAGDLQAFVEGSSEAGFVVFTLGSVIPSSSMPAQTVRAFLDAFAQLPQRVVWKWEKAGLENVPSNVMLVDWLPQQDLLGS